MSATAARVNVEIGAAFRGNFKAVFGQANAEVGKIGGTIKTLEGRQKELNAVIREQERLGAKGSPLKALYSQQEIAGITEKIAKLRAEQERLIGSAARMKQVGESMRSLGGAFGEVGGQLRSLATQATVAGVGLGYFFKKNFVDVASEFEKFKTILETTEGSAAGADKAMKWVSDFAAKTPYELAEVTSAFVKLRAYGLDPTTGLLKTLGDTGAAMGKPIMQAVEAIADAVTGENERLKEFGIKGSKSGGKVTYEFTDKAGKQQTRTVDANNRAMIESTLTAIWSEKYGGAMDKLSGTWAGMVSNLKDQWARFANNTMNAGLFDWMKTRLGGLLTELDRMAANGELQAWAERTGKALVTFAENAWALGKAIVDTTAKIAAFVGGWTNLGILIVAVKFIPLAIAVGKLGAALFTATSAVLMFATGTATLGAALKAVALFLMANPIVLALTLLSTAGFLLWQNWSEVKGGLTEVWFTIRDAGIAAFDALKSAVGGVIDWLAEKTAWIFATVDKVKAAASSIGDGVGNVWSRAKSVVGLGPEAAPAGAPMRAPAAAVPAGRGGTTYTDQSQFNASISITGATDVEATRKAVRAEMERAERERAAARRGQMTDALGY
jgi:hypothetical protein